MSAEQFRDAVQRALGAAPDVIEPGRIHRFSRNAKHWDTSSWCLLFDDLRAGVYGDFRDGVSGTWRAERDWTSPVSERLRHGRAQFLEAKLVAKQASWNKAKERQKLLAAQCVPIEPDGTGLDPVTLYLRRRLGLVSRSPLMIPDVLRWHPSLEYFVGRTLVGRYPAMVGVFQAADGTPTALHRTWLTPHGHKAIVPGPVKKLSRACGPIVGGSIRLYSPDESQLGVAEGIETALAATIASGVPTVSASSACGMAGFIWPGGVRRLVIFADNDPAGLTAAHRLQQRAIRAGLKSTVMRPTVPGMDWLDVWSQRDESGTGV